MSDLRASGIFASSWVAGVSLGQTGKDEIYQTVTLGDIHGKLEKPADGLQVMYAGKNPNNPQLKDAFQNLPEKVVTFYYLKPGSPALQGAEQYLKLQLPEGDEDIWWIRSEGEVVWKEVSFDKVLESIREKKLPFTDEEIKTDPEVDDEDPDNGKEEIKITPKVSESKDKIQHPDIERIVVDRHPPMPDRPDWKDTDTAIEDEAERQRVEELAAAKYRSKFMGKFGLKIFATGHHNDVLYKDVFTRWNTANPNAKAYNSSGVINDVRFLETKVGGGFALTTDPGYALLSNRWLLQFTPFEFATYGEGVSGSPDKFDLRILDVVASYAISERNFFDFGASLYVSDSMTLSTYALNVLMGLSYQLQGTPLGADQQKLSRLAALSFTESHTMLGFDLRFSAGDSRRGNEQDTPTGDDSTNYFVRGFDVNNKEFFEGRDELNRAIPTVRGRVNGVQSFWNMSLNYLLYADLFLRTPKLIVGGSLFLEIHAGSAYDFFLEARGRKLWSGEDRAIQLPDDGLELAAVVGAKIRFLPFFGGD